MIYVILWTFIYYPELENKEFSKRDLTDVISLLFSLVRLYWILVYHVLLVWYVKSSKFNFLRKYPVR